MATEIERKYLVLSMQDDVVLPEGLEIDQGYLASDGITVRVRTKGPKAYLTIKYSPEGQPERTPVPGAAIQREEFEYEIPVADARKMLDAAKSRLQKVRFFLPSGVELDIFKGRHQGLILAEFESDNGAQAPKVPGIEWVEVTEDPRYSNSWISRNGVPGRRG